MSEDPFCITNPSRKFYKFLFRVRLDEETLPVAIDFVSKWIDRHSWTIKRQKIVNMPIQDMFEIRAWLN